jgi:hypothetical protein
MGGRYICPHVVRKIGLLADRSQAAPNLKGVSRDAWLVASPDASGYLSNIPPSWPMRRVAAIAPSIRPSMYSMWTCLLGPVLKKSTILQAGIERRDPQLQQAVATAAQELQASSGITPSPSRVLQHVLDTWQG